MTSARSLNSHIKHIHEGVKDYKCYICSKSFTEAKTFKKHREIIHGSVKDQKCKYCYCNFTNAVYLKRHVKAVSLVDIFAS